ncbi:hypothetical protein DFA_02047 [Cavenderia fasciculata]|uniref:Uncharacterized protein n=1 Tax=Cavenderia fasciculata TaxID=261658 RepID=F4PYJ5_CACFS|nr:uncharacterized protein DFA_02047 [Cavenderia fasciculata]EGG19261.1 hypothetical protein DFA_02047 [Cavenderia fasciculata]|eukprot:XP_004357532.1 hypothetical protein DFA_02047 [Cavenderia fasciculata]
MQSGGGEEEEDYIKKIPTILLLKIINYVDDNVDLVCLLLSCKRLFNFTTPSAAVNYHLSFKHIEYKNPKSNHYINNINAYYSKKCYHLKSFKKMFTNTFSDTMIIRDKKNHGRDDSNNIIATAIVLEEYKDDSMELSLGIPQSTTSLTLHQPIRKPLPADFRFPPLLNHLTIHYETQEAIEKCNGLPDSLRSLTLLIESQNFPNKILPAGLERLDLYMGSNFYIEPRRLGLDTLTSLTWLRTYSIADKEDTKYCTLPKSLTYLKTEMEDIPSSPTYFRPLVHLVHLYLEILDPDLNNDTFGFIPSSVKTLELHMNPQSANPNEKQPIPDNVESLTLTGYNVSQFDKLPNSIKKLVIKDFQVSNDSLPTITLPNNLQEFKWIHQNQSIKPPPLQFIYPSTLKHIDYSLLEQPYKQPIPQSITEFKYRVSTTTNHNTKIHIIGRDDGDGLIFPSTLIKLSIYINRQVNDRWIFRFDHLINQSNIDQLVIFGNDINFQVDIRRLDPENRNVLILGKSLYGGIIHQQIEQQMKDNGGDDHQYQYQPIYLCFGSGNTPPKLKFNLSTKIVYKFVDN